VNDLKEKTITFEFNIDDFEFPRYGGCHDVPGNLSVTSTNPKHFNRSYELTGNIIDPKGKAVDYVWEYLYTGNESKPFSFFVCLPSYAPRSVLGEYSFVGKVEMISDDGYTILSSQDIDEFFEVSRVLPIKLQKKCNRLERKIDRFWRKKKFKQSNNLYYNKYRPLGCFGD